MSLLQFEREILGDRLAENDQVWFPRWLTRYAMTVRCGLVEDLPVNKSSVLKFSQALFANGAPAWQRYQAVRAVEFYRGMVLQKSEPELSQIVLKLAQMGRQERNIELEAAPTEEELAKLRGTIHLGEPLFIQTMRGEMRVLHYAAATEKAYVRWVKRFSGHVGSTALDQFDETDIVSMSARGLNRCICLMHSLGSIPTRARSWLGNGYSRHVSDAGTSGAVRFGGITLPRSSSRWRSRQPHGLAGIHKNGAPHIA